MFNKEIKRDNVRRWAVCGCGQRLRDRHAERRHFRDGHVGSGCGHVTCGGDGQEVREERPRDRGDPAVGPGGPRGVGIWGHCRGRGAAGAPGIGETSVWGSGVTAGAVVLREPLGSLRG